MKKCLLVLAVVLLFSNTVHANGWVLCRNEYTKDSSGRLISGAYIAGEEVGPTWNTEAKCREHIEEWKDLIWRNACNSDSSKCEIIHRGVIHSWDNGNQTWSIFWCNPEESGCFHPAQSR